MSKYNGSCRTILYDDDHKCGGYSLYIYHLVANWLLVFFNEVLEVRRVTRSVELDVSVFGLIQNVERGVRIMDDSGHHRFAYETFRMAFPRFIHPPVRYVAVECVPQEAGRVWLAAHMIMEVKDVVKYSDEFAWDENEAQPEGTD